ncbi:MAG TPA: N,N-dimethylformamidase beta subunit family domain-containing protein [Candidatus Dormibacteraeota bacterium]|nr:N,N-dimethylformamidase beta subunit family domain-containing protein [Candidatus Dormibacteraeota bacterium]
MRLAALMRNGFRRTPLVVLALALFASSSLPAIRAQAANTIETENQQPGSDAWQLGALVSDDATGQIKGYASATSVSQGQTITLFVTVNPAQTYTIDIFRLGWYQGLGGRLMRHVGPRSGTKQAACIPDQTTGLIACNWSGGFNLSIPTSWTSGVYVGLLTSAAGYTNYLIFVVKDGRPAPLLYQQSVNTYQAYNNYPDDKATGKSLYTFNSYGVPTVAGDARAVKVSFDRPYTAEGAGQFLFWEIDFIRWMERSGYDVTYSTDIDTHANGAALRNSKGFLAVGHDEYWSKPMYDAAEAARDAGVSLGFFGGNDLYWQVRYEASGRGVANRVMVCYKDASKDPVQGATTTVNWRSAPASRPEQPLMGVQYTSQVSWGNNVGYVVTNSSSWVYSGTGFVDGSVVPGIVGYEMDRFYPDYPAPNATTRTILSQSSFTGSNGPDYSNASIYRAPSGAWVFAAGTMGWANGLDGYYQNTDLTDWRIQRTTANLLDAFVVGTPPPPPPLQISAVQATPSSGSAVITWQTNNTANSRVDYGLTTSYGSTVSDPAAVTSHALTLSGLAGGTTYHYAVTSVDGNAQTASSADATFTTTSAAPPLQLSAVQAGNITASSAVITWQTNNTANSRVDYGTTPSFGGVVTDPSMVTSHSLTLSGLTPGTWYRYKVTSVDGYNQSATSADAFLQTGTLQNLVLNPGFESGSANWQLDASSSIDSSAANAHTGSHSLQLNAVLAWQGSAQYVPVTAGLSYTYSGWERSTSATGSSGYITLVSYDANWGQVGPSTSLVFGSTGSWSSQTATYVAPAGTVRVGIWLQNDGTGTFWFDDFSMTQP